MVAASDLGSDAVRRGGSSPFIRTGSHDDCRGFCTDIYPQFTLTFPLNPPLSSFSLLLLGKTNKFVLPSLNRNVAKGRGIIVRYSGRTSHRKPRHLSWLLLFLAPSTIIVVAPEGGGWGQRQTLQGTEYRSK